MTSAEVWNKTPNVEADFRTEMQCISDIKEGVCHVNLNLIMENLSCTFLLLFVCQNYLFIYFKVEKSLPSFKVAFYPWEENQEVISTIILKILHYIFCLILDNFFTTMKSCLIINCTYPLGSWRGISINGNCSNLPLYYFDLSKPDSMIERSSFASLPV